MVNLNFDSRSVLLSRSRRLSFVFVPGLAVVAALACVGAYFNVRLGLGSSRSWVEIGHIELDRFWVLVGTFIVAIAASAAALTRLAPIRLLMKAASSELRMRRQRPSGPSGSSLGDWNMEAVRDPKGQAAKRAVRTFDSGRVTSARPLPNVLLYAIIIFIALLIGLFSFEVYQRYVLYNKINHMVDKGVLWIQNQTLIRNDFDDYFGRKTVEIPKGLFKLNATFNIAVNHPTRGTLNFSVRTNNLGFLSDKTYQFERDPTSPEYRIVMLGDSMTGPTTSTYQWVDTVEDLLNTSQSQKKSVGGKTFRVYNLGWVAAGFQTFWKAYEKAGQYFSPDLVVVNYIEVDFPRTDLHQLQDEDQMIEHATSHLSKLQAANPNLLVALMPTYSEMLPTFTEYKLTRKLTQADPRVKVEIMRDRLPTQLGTEEIERWFQVPHDAHYSDRGGEIYARALARVIAERVSGGTIDFSRIRSQHSNEVLGRDAPRTRKIVTPLSQISDDPDKVAKIKSYIKKEMLHGKVYTLYSYSFHALLGLGDGLTIPYTKHLKVGYVKVPIGPNQDDVAYLSVSCLSGPASLRNPKCYHHFHMFVK